MNTTLSNPDSVSSVNITPAAPLSLRTMRCTPADNATAECTKALVHPVRDGAVVIERSEYVANREQHVVESVNVEKGFLLAGEGSVRQILRSSRGTHRERGITALPFGKGLVRSADL